MRLHQLKNVPGARHRRKRLGCGESSGHGKTSTRGGKGQTARTGSSLRIPFEGGQTPFYRRMPKRGFNNARFKTRFAVVNVEALNQFSANAEVDEKALRQSGLVNGRIDGVKILGDGELQKKLTVRAHAFSASAKAQIEKAGGQIELLTLAAPKQEKPESDTAPKPKAAKSKSAKPRQPKNKKA
ncbi:MAG: 50S ribosomal protein L15 [Verrucomicrobiae bacterium]|nr:50S ribosomal protein L15 [Verrucomicrobiae bacterium]